MRDVERYLRITLRVPSGAAAISIFGAFGLAFCALAMAQTLFVRTPSYPDFIVGAITWDAGSKMQDMLSYPAFLIGFLVGGWGIHRLFQDITALQSPEYERELVTTLIWWLAPVAVGAGSMLSIYPGSSAFPVFIGVAGMVVTAIAARLHVIRGNLRPHQLGIGALAVMLLGLLPYGVAAIQDRIPWLGEEYRFISVSKVAIFLLIVSAIYYFYICLEKQSNVVLKSISRLLLVAQLGIVPFYFLILPDLYLKGTDELVIHHTPWLWVLSFILAFAAAGDVLARNKNVSADNAVDLTRLLSPLAIFATTILFRNAGTVVPHIPSDDYHFGESLLGWWSSWQFGKVPYLDFFPPHGVFGDDVGGFLSLIFYDGTAATLAEADRLAATLTMLVAFIALRAYTGSIGVAYVSILLFGTISRKLFFLILVPFLCLWFKVNDSSPLRWLWTWVISSVVLVLLVPAQGLLAVVSSISVVMLHLVRLDGLRQFDWKRNAVMLAVLVGVLAAFTPLLAILQGAIRYVLENGPINQVAYGIPWQWSWAVAQDRSKTVLVYSLEFFRMFWIWIPLVAAVLVILLVRKRECRNYLLGVNVPILLFASLMVPYTMGRIDPGAMSRPGVFANFAWAILLPMLLMPLLASRGRAVLAACVGFVCAAIGLASVNKDGLRSVREMNQVDNMWSGSELGLVNIGTGLVDPQHVDRLVRINRQLSSVLAPRETYLDLTGRNAQYMYFDRPPPISTTAPYNLAAIKQQRRVVEELKMSLPRVALIEADNINHDGGGMALRTHLLYRFVLDHYDAELHDGFVYGIAKGSRTDQAGLSFTLSQLSDPNWENGVHRKENAVVIRDSRSVRYLLIGDVIVFPDNEIRRITRIWPEGNAIWFDGPRFMLDKERHDDEVRVLLDEQRKMEVSGKLLQDVFSPADLRKVPVAWGRSAVSLSDSMTHVIDLDLSHVGLNDLEMEGDVYRVTGSDPYFWVDLDRQNLAGEAAGLLKFDFFCDGGRESRVQIFWWGDGMPGADASQSLVFTAENGTVIVPIDAYPAWLSSQRMKGLRLDLDSPESCRAFSVQRASLLQRSSLTTTLRQTRRGY